MAWSPLKRLPISILIYIFIFVPELWAYSSEELERSHLRADFHTPCFYFNTVNVTGDQRFPNGSYLHEGVMIPHHYIGVYNYEYDDAVTRRRVEPHLRGCICKLKVCISFCCPVGQVHDGSVCVDASHEFEWPHTLNMTQRDGSIRTVEVAEQYAIVAFRPCAIMFAFDPTTIKEDAWRIFENGTVMVEYNNKYLTRQDYCMVPTTAANETNGTYFLNPANCDVDSGSGTVKVINAYAMIFSIPFMVLTIIVYMAIPELRNQHGKSLVCYLFGLIIGYSMMCVSNLNAELDVWGVGCKVIGYTCYYSFMVAFFWLNIISFDLWHNFRGTRGINRSLEKKRFIMYSLYSWGLPLLFLLATWYIQEFVDDMPYELKPGIGGGQYCWINMATWAGFIYFFTPIMFIMVANIIMFIMTALKIHKVQKEMSRIMAKEDSTRNLKKEKDRFGLFLRLFLVMGVTWSLEIVSYFVGTEGGLAKIFYAADICNAVQGFLIFMLFVMKRKVKQLITNRYGKGPGTPQSNSTNSTNSINSVSTQKSKIYAIPMETANPTKF